MTRCVGVPDATPGKENPAARGSGATRLYLTHRNGSSLQRQGIIEVNYIATASLKRSRKATGET